MFENISEECIGFITHPLISMQPKSKKRKVEANMANIATLCLISSVNQMVKVNIVIELLDLDPVEDMCLPSSH